MWLGLGGMGQLHMPLNVPGPLKLHRILQVCILRHVKLCNPFSKPDGMFEKSSNMYCFRISNILLGTSSNIKSHLQQSSITVQLSVVSELRLLIRVMQKTESTFDNAYEII